MNATRPPGRPPERGAKADRSVRVPLTADELAWLDERRGETPKATFLRQRAFASSEPEREDGPEVGALLPIGRAYMKAVTQKLGYEPTLASDVLGAYEGSTGTAIVTLFSLLGMLRPVPVGHEDDPGPDE